MSAPTGPAATNNGTRGGGRRQLADINNALQGGPTARGRNSRSNLAGSDAQVLTGVSPLSPQVHERPDPMLPGERGANGNERYSRHDPERARNENTDRALRTSRHASRERSTGRERAPKEREYRERKSGAGGPVHSGRDMEREPPRRSTREPSGLSRDPLSTSSGRGDMTSNGREGGRDGRHRGDGGRHEEFARTGGGGRGGGPSGRDDRRELRKGDDRGRKRQSEEFNGGPTEKRQRR